MRIITYSMRQRYIIYVILTNLCSVLSAWPLFIRPILTAIYYVSLSHMIKKSNIMVIGVVFIIDFKVSIWLGPITTVTLQQININIRCNRYWWPSCIVFRFFFMIVYIVYTTSISLFMYLWDLLSLLITDDYRSTSNVHCTSTRRY